MGYKIIPISHNRPWDGVYRETIMGLLKADDPVVVLYALRQVMGYAQTPENRERILKDDCFLARLSVLMKIDDVSVQSASCFLLNRLLGQDLSGQHFVKSKQFDPIVEILKGYLESSDSTLKLAVLEIFNSLAKHGTLSVSTFDWSHKTIASKVRTLFFDDAFMACLIGSVKGLGSEAENLLCASFDYLLSGFVEKKITDASAVEANLKCALGNAQFMSWLQNCLNDTGSNLESQVLLLLKNVNFVKDRYKNAQPLLLRVDDVRIAGSMDDTVSSAGALFSSGRGVRRFGSKEERRPLISRG